MLLSCDLHFYNFCFTKRVHVAEQYCVHPPVVISQCPANLCQGININSCIIFRLQITINSKYTHMAVLLSVTTAAPYSMDLFTRASNVTVSTYSYLTNFSVM